MSNELVTQGGGATDPRGHLFTRPLPRRRLSQNLRADLRKARQARGGGNVDGGAAATSVNTDQNARSGGSDVRKELRKKLDYPGWVISNIR